MSLLLAWSAAAAAPAGQPQYGTPSEPIVRALDMPPQPLAFTAPDGSRVALLSRASMPPIAELARPALGLAGTVIDPANNGPARGLRFEALRFVSASGSETAVALPPGTRISTPRWAPDGSALAFLIHGDTAIALWTASSSDGTIHRVASGLNAAFPEPFAWLPDSSGFLVRLVLADRGAPPTPRGAPKGPEVRESGDRAVAVQTIANLLQDRHDDALFRHYFTSRLATVTASGGSPRTLGTPGIFSSMAVSPNGRYILTEQLREPFSRAFAASSFPAQVDVLDRSGEAVRRIADRPGAESYSARPGTVHPGPRAIAWRTDAPATLVWAEAEELEGQAGDSLWTLSAPFGGAPVPRGRVSGRFVRAYWGSLDFAVLAINQPGGRGHVELPFDPSQEDWGSSDIDLLERGERFVLRPGVQGAEVLTLSPGGEPFALDPGVGGQADRILRIAPDGGRRGLVRELPKAGHQRVLDIVDPEKGRAFAWRETPTSPPNLYFLPESGGARQLTSLPDPAPEFADQESARLLFRRQDGTPLSATLHLPPIHAEGPPRGLPTVFWAYPVMRTDAPSERSDESPSKRFVRPRGLDPLLLTLSGYAVLIADMPVLVGDGQGGFVEQIVANSSAAIDAAVDTGWVDRNRIAAAGHSFGAGMVANLLAGSDLFASGIALSGAYNRTLTPFGFQTERRNLWEAREEYLSASPLLYADGIDEPLLLVHGMADSNSGTTPMQSERMFEALRGLGRPAKLVLLPHEGHQYSARESILHVMSEIESWLDQTIGAPSKEELPDRR